MLVLKNMFRLNRPCVKLLMVDAELFTLAFSLGYIDETFEKYSILFKVKEGENFNHRHTLSISRIKIQA